MKRLSDCSWIPFGDAELANAILNNALHSCLALPKVSIISAWQICFFVCFFLNIGMACFICTDISVTTYRETTDPTRQLVCRKQRVPKKTEQVRVWGALKLECSQLCYLWSYWRLFLTFLVWTPKTFPGLHLIGRYFITGCWFVQTVCFINTLKQLKKLYCKALMRKQATWNCNLSNNILVCKK